MNGNFYLLYKYKLVVKINKQVKYSFKLNKCNLLTQKATNKMFGKQLINQFFTDLTSFLSFDQVKQLKQTFDKQSFDLIDWSQ